MKEIHIKIVITDAEDGEPLHLINSFSIDSAIEALGSYERNHMKDGKAI